MEKIYESIVEYFQNRKIIKKLSDLEKEIEEVRELTTSNYWKLQKQISNGKKSRKKTV